MDQGRSSDELLRRLEALDRRTQELATLVAQKDAIIAEQQALIAVQQEQIAALQFALDRAREQLAVFKKAMFGPRRERYVPSPDQQLLFEALPLETKPLHDAPSALPEPPPTKPRRKPRRKFLFPDFLPVRREDHSLQPHELPCGCCGEPRVVIRTLVTKQLELEQAQAYVVEHVRYTYACPGCREGSQVVTTPKPPVPIEKSPFGASVLAWITSA